MEILNQYGMIDYAGFVGPNANEDTQALIDQVGRLSAILSGYDIQRSNLSSDQNLTAVGKTAKQVEINTRVRDRLLAESKRIDGIQSQVASLTAQIAPSGFNGGTDTDAREIRAVEIRRNLMALDDISRASLVDTAVTVNGDMELLRAVKNAPASFPVVDADLLSNIIDRLTRQSHPVQYAEIADLKVLADRWSYNVNVACAYCGVTIGDGLTYSAQAA
jgi:hypothetical protein